MPVYGEGWKHHRIWSTDKPVKRPALAIIIEIGSSWQHTQKCLDTLRPALDLERDSVMALASTDAQSKLKLYSWVNIMDMGLDMDGNSNVDRTASAAPSESMDNSPNYGYLLNQAMANLDLSIYDLMLIIDSSTLIDSVALHQIVETFNNPQVGAVGPLSNDAEGRQLASETAYDPDDAASLRHFSRNWVALHGSETVTTDWLDTVALTFRRSALDKSAASDPLGPFNAQLHDPVYVKEDMLRRIARSGWQLQVATGAFVHHESSDYRLPLEADRALFLRLHGEYPRSSPPLLVSACLITKDEESNLPDCLESLEGFVDEVVIYDTGSSDRTTEIAKNYGATVINGYWDDDFSRARNASLAECKGQWILWIDADERLACHDPAGIKQSLTEMPANVEGCLIHIDNLEGTGVTSAFTHPACRMFRRTRCHWHGRLHEQISLIDQTAQRAPFLVPFSKIRLLHTGYLDEAIRKRAKPERNLALAVEEMGETEGRDESYLKISLARSKTMTGDVEEAVKVSLEAAESAADPTTKRLGIRTAIEGLIGLGKLDEALEQVEILRNCSANPVTANSLEAKIRLQSGEPELALALLETIGSREVDDDMFEYRATQFAGAKARALAAMGRHSEAADMLLASLAEEGTLDAHLGDLLDALEKAGRSPGEIARVLERGRKLTAFMAQIAQLPPGKADVILQRCYEHWQGGRVPHEIMAAAAIVARRLPIPGALEWSARLKEMDLGESYPLLAKANDSGQPLLERALAAATAIYAFGDLLAYRALRSILKQALVMDHDTHTADGPTELQAIQANIEALAPGAAARAILDTSIIIYCHNDASATQECLTSIQQNTEPGSYEIILVDDASTDATRELEMVDNRYFRIHRNASLLGMMESYRLGVQLASAPYVLLMDQHSLVSPGWTRPLEDMLAMLCTDASQTVSKIIILSAGQHGTGNISAPSPVAIPRNALPLIDWSALHAPEDILLQSSTSRPQEPKGRMKERSTALHRQDTESDPSSRAIPPSSVHVIGPLGIASGLGQSARSLLEALETAGIASICTSLDTLHRESAFNYPQTSDHDGHPEDHDIDITCFNPDTFISLASNKELPSCNASYRIARWDWELEAPPAKTEEMLPHVDEIWVLSNFERRSFEQSTSKPIHIFPYPIAVRNRPPAFSRSALGVPEGFLFLSMFDLFSTVQRKNPVGLIEAFTRAFEPGEGPALLVKINNADRTSGLIKLRQLARGRHDIIFMVNDTYANERMDSLVAACDCYVSLHRSEGFGLPLADAMAWGKPVIATGYSGNLDFMDEDNAYLVPWRYTELAYDDDPYPKGARWAEPDLNAAARLMRYMYDHQDEAKQKGALAMESIRASHSPEASAAFLKERIGAIRSNIQGRTSRTSVQYHIDSYDTTYPASQDQPPHFGPAVPLRSPPIGAAASNTPATGTDGLGAPSSSPGIPKLSRLDGVDLLPPGSNYRGSNIVFRSVSRALVGSPFPCHEMLKNDTPQYNAMLLFMDPDAIPSFAVERGQSFFERYTICCFDWPLDELSANMKRGLRYVNEIWVPSEQAYRAVSNAVNKPVVKLPIQAVDVMRSTFASPLYTVAAPSRAAVAKNAAESSPDMSSNSLLQELNVDPGQPYLLNVADTRYPFEMTNALGTIQAFSRAFPDPNHSALQPVLIVVQSSGHVRPNQLERLVAAKGDRDDITIISPLGMEQIVTLIGRCNCYISLHRASGFNWPLLLAASFGIPAIATGGSADEWSTTASFHPVPASEGTVPSGCWPYPEGASWTEPDIEKASSSILGMFEEEVANLDLENHMNILSFPAHVTGTSPIAASTHSDISSTKFASHPDNGNLLSAAPSRSTLSHPDNPSQQDDLQSILTSRLRFAHNAFRRANQLAKLHGRHLPPPHLPAVTHDSDNTANSRTYQDWIAKFDSMDDDSRARLARHLDAVFPPSSTQASPTMSSAIPPSSTPIDPPLISIIMPVYNTPEPYLRRAVDSVTDQVYKHWELCIADDAS
ncbi:MAG: glycosyltransferase, partial [Acidimicrobiales bacterium]